MGDFTDLGEYLSPTLDLPVGGVTYRVPSPPAAVGLRLQAAFAVTTAREAGTEPKARHLALLAEDTGTTLEQDALGPVHDQMLADDVNFETLTHAGMTAYLWIVAGKDAARLYWAAPRGEASRPFRSISTSTGEAPTTTPPASGTGTRSRRKSSSGSRTPATA